MFEIINDFTYHKDYLVGHLLSRNYLCKVAVQEHVVRWKIYQCSIGNFQVGSRHLHETANKVVSSGYRVLKCDVIKFSVLHFSIFMTIFQ